ncbi:MAG: hypothetical protein IT305_27305 [Chloroflexi bacterium]|nr:hypothetical protein [Chloroflexota bacterium]
MSDSTDAGPSPARVSKLHRRGLMTGVSAIAAAAIAKLVTSGPAPTAFAAPGDPMLLEVENTVTNTTALTKQTGNNNSALLVTANQGAGIAILAPQGAGLDAQGTTGVIARTLGGGGVAVRADTAAGFAVYGSIGGGSIAAVYGESSGAAAGVRAFSQGAEGVLTQGSTGIRAEARDAGGAKNGTAVRALVDSGISVFASSTAPSAVAVYGEATGGGTGVRGVATGTGSVGVYGSGQQFAGSFDGNMQVRGNFEATGTKSAIIPVGPDEAVRLYCMESPESYFEDFGRSTLDSNGEAWVKIDPQFARVVNLDGYFAFVTPEGDCHGLFVARRDKEAFLVKELGSGASGVSFTWRLLAKRADVQDKTSRLDVVPLGKRPADPSAADRADRPIPEIPASLRDVPPPPTRRR